MPRSSPGLVVKLGFEHRQVASYHYPEHHSTLGSSRWWPASSDLTFGPGELMATKGSWHCNPHTRRGEETDCRHRALGSTFSLQIPRPELGGFQGSRQEFESQLCADTVILTSRSLLLLSLSVLVFQRGRTPRSWTKLSLQNSCVEALALNVMVFTDF